MASWHSLAIISRFSGTMAAPRGARRRWLFPVAGHAARRLRGQLAADLGPSHGRGAWWRGALPLDGDDGLGVQPLVGHGASLLPAPWSRCRGWGGYRALGAGVLPGHRNLLRGGTLLPLPCSRASAFPPLPPPPCFVVFPFISVSVFSVGSGSLVREPSLGRVFAWASSVPSTDRPPGEEQTRPCSALPREKPFPVVGCCTGTPSSAGSGFQGWLSPSPCSTHSP